MNDDAAQLLARWEPKELKVIETQRQVHAARFSPCGRFLIAGGYDALVRRWDMTRDETPELSPLTGHQGWAQALAFHPQGEILFTSDSWGRLSAWPYAEENPQPRWTVAAAHGGWIRGLAVSPDGALLASCGRDQVLRLWSTAEGRVEKEWAGHNGPQEDVFCVQFHPAGKMLAAGDARGAVQLWDLAAGACTRTLDAAALYLYDRIQDVGGVWCLAFDAAGKYLAAGGTRGKNGATVQGVPTVLVFDVETGEQKHKLELGAQNDCFVHDLHFHPAGFLMAVTSGTPGAGKVLFQRLEDPVPFFVTTKLPNCHSLSLNPAGDRLAVVATNRNSNGNGRPLNQDGEYEGNHSPVHLFQLAASGQPQGGRNGPQ
jgi:WD40 repeat protein